MVDICDRPSALGPLHAIAAAPAVGSVTCAFVESCRLGSRPKRLALALPHGFAPSRRLPRLGDCDSRVDRCRGRRRERRAWARPGHERPAQRCRVSSRRAASGQTRAFYGGTGSVVGTMAKVVDGGPSAGIRPVGPTAGGAPWVRFASDPPDSWAPTVRPAGSWRVAACGRVGQRQESHADARSSLGPRLLGPCSLHLLLGFFVT
jgi:hypothetical protein